MAKYEKDIENWFGFHEPTADQVGRYAAILEQALAFARVVLASTPPSAGQTSALRKTLEAATTAFVAVSRGALEHAPAPAAPRDVYSRPECIYQYCPIPDDCRLRGKCESDRGLHRQPREARPDHG